MLNLQGTNGTTTDDLHNAFVSQNKYSENAMNLFVTNRLASGCANTDVFYDINPNTSTTFYDYQIPHEMGHTFGLLHVSSFVDNYSLFMSDLYDNLPTCINGRANQFIRKPIFTSPGQGSTLFENVTRDIDSPNYNADSAGDFVTDTHACTSAYIIDICSFPFTSTTNPNNDTYPVDSRIVDYVGEPYKDIVFEYHNFMEKGTHDWGHFTPGQGVRMRNTIMANQLQVYAQRLNKTDDGQADVSVLYEPFISTDSPPTSSVSGMALSKTYAPNSNNTGANVWNCGPFKYRFKTGFDCEFYDLSNNTIITTPYMQFDTTANNNFGLKIPILGPEIVSIGVPACFSSFEPYTSGDVKSLDNLGIGTYTQLQLDEIKTSDPDLYKKLQSGQYHIITKKTDSGFIDNKTIFKK